MDINSEQAVELRRIYSSIGREMWDTIEGPPIHIQQRFLSGYANVGDQLDMLYWDVSSGVFGDEAKNSAWFLHCSGVKEQFPKP